MAKALMLRSLSGRLRERKQNGERAKTRDYTKMPILLQRLHQLLIRTYGSEAEFIRTHNIQANALWRLFGGNKTLDWRSYKSVLEACGAEDADLFKIEGILLTMELSATGAGEYKVRLLPRSERAQNQGMAVAPFKRKRS